MLTGGNTLRYWSQAKQNATKHDRRVEIPQVENVPQRYPVHDQLFTSHLRYLWSYLPEISHTHLQIQSEMSRALIRAQHWESLAIKYPATMKQSTKSPPSPYNALAFHSIRCIQLLSAVSVAGSTGYFIRHLLTRKSPIPWMFYLVHPPILSYSF